MKFGIEHCLYQLPAPQMIVYQRWDFIRTHPAIPDLFWQDQHHWTIATLP
jgi:hypothetical protein